MEINLACLLWRYGTVFCEETLPFGLISNVADGAALRELLLEVVSCGLGLSNKAAKLEV